MSSPAAGRWCSRWSRVATGRGDRRRRCRCRLRRALASSRASRALVPGQRAAQHLGQGLRGSRSRRPMRPPSSAPDDSSQHTPIRPMLRSPREPKDPTAGYRHGRRTARVCAPGAFGLARSALERCRSALDRGSGGGGACLAGVRRRGCYLQDPAGYLVVTLNRFQTLTRAISMISEARPCSS
jgi:hypothetical protein